ncbi:putative carboxypeptidase y [Rosellinia necatrix]|uniref:carboxypeptidase C n=1 Tax=Rosellinia necatrix TaxID=77044 RepID=A0A1S7UIX4_ROSNE|nr:putative carboxypeptidase y [Rosellinia necatrix]
MLLRIITRTGLVCGLAAAATVRAAAVHFDATAQKPLETTYDDDDREPTRARPAVASGPSSPSSSFSWPVYPQDNRTCAAGTTHFTGRVPVTAEKELFFWFAESRRDPRGDPTVLWLNGGPAASSMPGFFQEIGPCELVGNGTGGGTTASPHSWADFANLLVLDQPAGAGLSTAAGDSAPVTLAEGTVDFGAFLAAFVARFPQYFGRGFYVAGESFGGRYAPRYVADIVRGQLEGAPDALPVKIDGLILVDAFIDGVSHMIGHHALFCTDEYQDLLRFNETVCRSIAAAVPRAEYLLGVCQETQDPEDCGAATEYASANIERYFRDEVAQGRFSPYDLRLPCELPDMSCIPPAEFYTESYLNRPEIQALLGFDTPREYRATNFSLNAVWSEQPEILVPTTRNVSWLLDDGGLRMLVFNGVYDAAITTPGMFREFDQLPWSQQHEFRVQPKVDWHWTGPRHEVVEGGKIKGLARLQVASVYDAGHMSPGDAKSAVSSLVQRWLETPLTRI